MSYQVIARKWRPQAFEDVTGQEPITRTLRGAIEHDRLHHAYLFSGARGVGKTTTARLLAKALNCHRAERPTPTPCAITDPDACPSCREVAEGRSIDVLEIDAASNTGVDNVRESIINSVAVRPARDRYKIFIIDEVHMLSGAAFNALLKTLEEPPPRVVFIMATTEAHKLPDTILSRCQQFEFRTIAASRIAERLRFIADAEKIDVSDDALREIARAGEGSMRDAQSAFDQVISFSADKIGVEDVETALGITSAEVRARVMHAIAEGASTAAIATIDDLVMRGHDLRNFCRDLLAHVRDLLVSKVSGDKAAGLTDSSETERRELAREADAFSESDLVRFFHSLTETEKALRESAHPRYQLEIGLVKLIEMRRLAPINQLLERIAALEEHLRGGTTMLASAEGPASPPPTPQVGGGREGGRGSLPRQSGSTATSSAPGSVPANHKSGDSTRADDVPFPVGEHHSSGAAVKPSAPPSVNNRRPAPAPSSPPSSPALKLVPSTPAEAVRSAPPSFFDAPEDLNDDRVGARVPASVVTSNAFSEDVNPASATVAAPPASDNAVERLKVALEERRKPFLVVAIEGARRVQINTDELYIEYAPTGKHLRDTLMKPENVKVLREACRDVAGRDVGVRIIVKEASEGHGSAPLTEQDEALLEKQKLRAMVEQHPAVQELLRTFRAEIIDVGRVETKQ